MFSTHYTWLARQRSSLSEQRRLAGPVGPPIVPTMDIPFNKDVADAAYHGLAPMMRELNDAGMLSNRIYNLYWRTMADSPLGSAADHDFILLAQEVLKD